MEEAITCLENALGIYHHCNAPPKHLLAPLSQLLLFRIWNGEYQKAEAVAEEALAIIADLDTLETNSAGDVFKGIAALRRLQGRYVEAESLIRQAVQLDRRVHGDQNNSTAWSLSNLGLILENQQKLQDSEAAQRESLSIMRRNYTIEHSNFRTIALRLARVLHARGDASEANALVAEVLAGFDERVRRKLIRPEDCRTLALFLVMYLDALPESGRAVDIAIKGCELTDYKDPSLLDALAAANAAKGEFTLAVEWSEKALNLTTDSAKRTRMAEHLKAVQNGKLWWSKLLVDNMRQPVSTPIPKTEL
jgi:tetratricopeptide (TPR) repeat protein